MIRAKARQKNFASAVRGSRNLHRWESGAKPMPFTTMNFYPILAGVGTIGTLALLGYIISYFRGSVDLSGYQEIAEGAKSVARAMQAKIFRDGDDLVISGYYGELPAMVRFSNARNAPRLNIRMKAPSTLRMSVVPKGTRATEGRVAVPTDDEMFNLRFAILSDHPTPAKRFLTGGQALELMQKLCCFSKNSFQVSAGNLELSELVIPTQHAARHINDHLDSMAKVAQVLGAMPGAEQVKITPFKRKRDRLITAAIAVLAFTGLIGVASAVEQRLAAASAVSADAAERIPAGVSPTDFPHMRALAGWRLATADDFDPDAVGWASAQTVDVSGHITAQFDTAEDRPDSAYIFIETHGPQVGMRRVVMLERNEEKLDITYPSLAIAGRVAHDNFPTIQWQGKPPVLPPDGDGLLVVLKADDPASGIIFYTRSRQIVTLAPANYQNVSVE